MLNNKEKGASLIVTFFIMTIALAVVLSVSIILYSEIKIIKNIGKSVVAFYAADSGVEKVLYYDRKQTPVGLRRGICNICVSCLASGDNCDNCEAIVPGDSDCETDGCEECDCCEITFESSFNEKDYSETVNVLPEGKFSVLTVESFGSYKSVNRAVELETRIIGTAAPTIQNAYYSIPEYGTISVSADVYPDPEHEIKAVTGLVYITGEEQPTEVYMYETSDNHYEQSQTGLDTSNIISVSIEACDNVDNCKTVEAEEQF